MDWLDLTVRPEADCEIDVQPDKTVELSWRLGVASRATILVDPESAKRLSRRLSELVVLIPVKP